MTDPPLLTGIYY